MMTVVARMPAEMVDGVQSESAAWSRALAMKRVLDARRLTDLLCRNRNNVGVWDLMRPLEGDCKLELVTFDHPDGKEVRACGNRGDGIPALRDVC